MLENRTYGSDDSPEKLVRYVYSNHLQSASLYSPQSPFVYCSDNPINRVDPSGMGDDPTLVKPKAKVNPNVVKELTKDLPEGGKQISKEFADELLKKAEQLL